MHPLYVLQAPSEPARPPARWSYSALAVWRECPRRWWLLHSRYPNSPAPSYPVPYGVGALRGRLVHATLEAYTQYSPEQAARAGNESVAPHFNARRFLKQTLRMLLTEEAVGNPRLAIPKLQAGISLDECLALFYSIVEKMPARKPRSSQTTAAIFDDTTPPQYAEELSLWVEDPPICGRIDRVSDKRPIDFKTGEPSGAHAEQLFFYATLWWLKFGQPPQGLQLVYPERAEPQEVEVPATSALESMAKCLRTEIAEVAVVLDGGHIPARPSPSTCQYCPVRQLCTDYWTSPSTLPLRSADFQGEDAVSYRDIRLGRLPDNWAPNRPLRGVAHCDNVGEIMVSIDGPKCPDDAALQAVGARLLGARIDLRPPTREITASQSCEAFWEVAGQDLACIG